MDFAVPFDANVETKEEEKIKNYRELVSQVEKMYRVSAKVVPIVVGSLGVVSSGLVKYLKQLGIGDVIGGLQTTALIGTAAILRKVLLHGQTEKKRKKQKNK